MPWNVTCFLPYSQPGLGKSMETGRWLFFYAPKANTTQPAMDPSVPSSSGQPPPTTQSNPGGSRSNPQRPPTQRPKNNTRRPPKNNSNQPRPNNNNPRFEKKERTDANNADESPQNNNSQKKRNPQPKRNPNNTYPKRRPVNSNQPDNVSTDHPVAVQPWAEQQTTAKPKKFANLSDMGSGAPKKMQHDNRPQVDLKEEDVQKKYEGYSELSGKIIRELLNNTYECMVCCEGKKSFKSFFSIF